MIPSLTPRFSQELDRARADGKPVVALESSVLAQGLPVPANRSAHDRMVRAVLERGAVAGVTAVVRGVPVLGLESADLERFLARDKVIKVSSRDIGFACARQLDGATTVAASLTIAGMAGVRVFATGGIGGVHRASSSGTRRAPHDESADLVELARRRMIVVCAGAKSILDLPATWERLETLGVPVIGFMTDELPGFFTAETGVRLSQRSETAAEIAEIAMAHWGAGNHQSVLVVQSPPAGLALRRPMVDRAVDDALAAADKAGVSGGAVTPFLLEAVSRLTEGRSLEVNLALLEQNAALAAEIAVAMRQRG